MDARTMLPSQRGPSNPAPLQQPYRMQDFASPDPQYPSRTPSPSVASVASFHRRNQDRSTSLDEFHDLQAEVALEGIRLTPPPNLTTLNTDVETSYAPHLANPDEDFPTAPQHNYRASFTNALRDRYSKFAPLIPKASNNTNAPLTPPTSGPPSPTKTWASYASAAGTRAKHASRASLLGDLLNFQATSAPLSIGVLPSNRSYVSSEADSDLAYGSEMESLYNQSPSPNRARRELNRHSSSNSINRLSSWFTGRTTAVSKRASTARLREYPDEEEEYTSDPLLSLDINAALFPHGPADPLNPSDFHDLVSNAEAVISTLQSAYRSKILALDDMRRELSVQGEEADEAETRARHLKVQLDDMARKSQQQDDLIAELSQQLEVERRQRIEEKDVERQRSMVKRRGAVVKRMPTIKNVGNPTPVNVHSDSGFESGEESDASGAAPGSVFSEDDSQRGNGNWVTVPLDSKPAMHARNPSMGRPMSLQIENQMLRMRVAELEEAVDSCLEMVA